MDSKNSRADGIGKTNVFTGYLVTIGGVLAILLAPIMVIIKYMTGWAIVPKPVWIDAIFPAIEALFSFGTPVELWVVYGLMYSLALTLMIIGLVAFGRAIFGNMNKVQKFGYYTLMIGIFLVLVGDGVHTTTWHQNGLTVPTPGTNPVANTGYATGMMGMNFILIGSLVFGISALRKKLVQPWLAWLFILITPSAPLITLTILPTTPSGGLLLFSIMMVLLGYSFLSKRITFPIQPNSTEGN